MADPDPGATSKPPEAADGRPPVVSRRAALGAAGLGVVGGAIAGGGTALWFRRTVPRDPDPGPGTPNDGNGTSASESAAADSITAGVSSSAPATPSTTATADPGPGAAGVSVAKPMTLERWSAVRGDFYFIAHRGSGDVYPENSLAAFEAAVAANAKCLEISVGMTSDGRLICMHDPTYDRTTTATGNVADQPSTILRSVALKSPQLGPAWNQSPLPRVPFLEQVLPLVGGRAVVCLEAKDDAAYPSMMALAESFGLADSIIVKAYYTSPRIAQAKADGYPVFAYIGAAQDVTPDVIDSVAAQLDRATDYLIVPAYDPSQSDGYLAEPATRRCVATGIPVWVYPIHRRADAAHFKALGVRGIVTSSYAYVSGSSPTAISDTWRYQAIAPGEMTKYPTSPDWAPVWSDPDELVLARQGYQHFITLGQLSPIAGAAEGYHIDFQARFTTRPAGGDDLTIAFCCTDDRYYENGIDRSSGYHAVVRADGRLELYRHDASSNVVALGSALDTPAPSAGRWMQLRVEVTPTQVSWSRMDDGQHTIAVVDSTARGGYVHIGRGSRQGVVAFRRLQLT